MVGYYGQGVPTSVDLENNSSQKKYTVNKVPKGHLVISKLLCCLMALGALVLIALAAVATFFLLPKCASAKPEALVTDFKPSIDTHIDKRLPRSIEPQHYRLKLVPHLDGNFTTDGSVTISLLVKDETRKIIFHMNDIDLNEESVRVKKSDGKNNVLKIASKEYDAKSQRYTLTTEDILAKDEQLELEMKFTGHLNDYMQGFYRSSYTSNNEIRWMASTQFSPTDARRAFPCFDEPSFKAKFRISIARHKNLTALSNMPLEKSDAYEGLQDWVWDHFQETPLMSTYLVAFVVSDLQPYSQKSNSLNYTIWTRRELIDQTLYAFDLLPRILDYFANYFQMKFPLSKIDVVAIPDFGFSAMENWGLITFREIALLFENKVSTIDQKTHVATVMSHELAHQWFGNLVTPAWWDDLWMKEGFARYFEYVGVNSVDTSWYIMDEFPTSEIEAAFSLDSLSTSKPISFAIRNNADIRQAFDGISYSKGGSLVRMVRHILGEESFRNGLSKFLNEYKYKNANHGELWDVLTTRAQEDNVLDANLTLRDVMDSWITKPGFPVVNARRNGTTVYVNQHRFLRSGQVDKDTLWHVPISYTSAEDPNFEDTEPKAWLAQEEATSFTLETNTWYLINLQQTGYYIVNYDERNWKSLIRYGDQMLPPIIKGQLICDSMDLAAAGLLDYAIPFELITSMSGNMKDGLIKFKAMLSKLRFLKNILSTTEAYGDFETFVLTTFDHPFNSVDVYQKRLNNYQAQRLTHIIFPWACMKSDSRCSLGSHRLFRQWMSNGTPVENAKEVVYCTAIREGDDPEWDFALKQYKETKVASEKDILLNAMGCSRKPWVLAKYLNMMLRNDSVIRKQDGDKVFAAVAQNMIGYSIAFDFLRNNWKEINDYYGNGFGRIARMVGSLHRYMNTPFQLAEFKQFREKNKNTLGVSENAMDAVIEKISINVEWMNKNFKSVATWLDNYKLHFSLRK